MASMRNQSEQERKRVLEELRKVVRKPGKLSDPEERRELQKLLEEYDKAYRESSVT